MYNYARAHRYKIHPTLSYKQYRNNTGEKHNMTYTTEEKQTIAELRHKSKMDTLNQIAIAEGDYNKATATHKATLDRKIAEYELKAKNDLKVSINSALAFRTDETEMDEGDDDE